VKKLHFRRPSPAMLVALAALFIALGGTASAALVITGANVRNGSLSGRDIKNGTIKGADVRNNSLTAKDIRGRLRGPAGPAGPAGTARAFAEMAANGQVNGLLSRNIARVAHPAKGVYCFYLAFQPVNAVASLAVEGPGSVDTVKVTVLKDDAHGDTCAGPESASVRTYNVNGRASTRANAGFYVMFN
jgi:hypothetical protein